MDIFLLRSQSRYNSSMKYFTFIDRDSFHYSRSKIWETVLHIQAWPTWWKHVVSVTLHTEEKVSESSKIECLFSLFHFIDLQFKIQIICLKKPYYASFNISGDFTGQGRWILKEDQFQTSSTFYLHLQTRHKLLCFIAYFPFGKRLIEYSHRRVMLEGKKMILQRLSIENA